MHSPNETISWPHFTLGVLCVIALLVMLVLQSCTFLKESPNSSRALVQLSVAKYAEQSSLDKRAERLARVRSAALDIQTIAGSDNVTLAALNAVAQSKVVAAQLSPTDALAINALIDIVGEQLAQAIHADQLKPDDVVLVKNVMQWIVDACDVLST